VKVEMTEYRIHPSIGIARVGESDSFYLTPIKEGGLPIECDKFGNEIHNKNGDNFEYVRSFKDEEGKIRKQAAKFKIYKYSPDKKTFEVDLNDKSEIESVKWTVHLANKKAAWYAFSEYDGDTLFNDPKKGIDNSYEAKKVPLRNPNLVGPERQKLIIDFGPRTIRGRRRLGGSDKKDTNFSSEGVPQGYPIAYSPPSKVTYGPFPLKSLGEIRTDDHGNLIVLGGSGNAAGDTPISGFAGAETWHDDISDGPVTCTIKLKNVKKPLILKAWVIVCSPKFAPELRNISTLDDAVFDVYVRQFNVFTKMFDKARKFSENKIASKTEKISIRREDPEFKHWNPDYNDVEFERDIWPLIDRAGDYRWVANVPSMISFHWPSFDARDDSPENWDNRQRFYKYFRDPGNLEKRFAGQRNTLFENGVPLMPQNSGSNSVTDEFVDKFATVTNTQYFMLGQWANGKFKTRQNNSKKKCKVCDAELKNEKALRQHWKNGSHKAEYRLDDFRLHPLDRDQLANCVGIPMCPGIEVTWNMKNKIIYDEKACDGG